MKSNKVDITFFTPTLNRTGSELVLLNLIKSLPLSGKFAVVSKYKGPLYEQLPDHFQKNYIFHNQQPIGIINKVIRKVTRKIRFNSVLKQYKDSVWYINTIVLPDVLNYAVENNITVILHVHELQHMYKLLSGEQIKTLATYPKLIIANSEISKKVLLDHKVKQEIKIINPSADYSAFKFNQELYKNNRGKLGVNNEFIWVMSGSYDDNKNPKLFIDITAVLKKSGLSFKMMWIGTSGADDENLNAAKKYALISGVDKDILWIHNTNDYYQYMNCADGLVLTSKLESFSLVTLEALHLGLPIVANNCLGVKEILGKEYGVVIDNENAEQMSAEMIKIMQRQNTRNIEAGKNIAERFDLKLIQDKWLNILKSYLMK